MRFRTIAFAISLLVPFGAYAQSGQHLGAPTPPARSPRAVATKTSAPAPLTSTQLLNQFCNGDPYPVLCPRIEMPDAIRNHFAFSSYFDKASSDAVRELVASGQVPDEPSPKGQKPSPLKPSHIFVKALTSPVDWGNAYIDYLRYLEREIELPVEPFDMLDEIAKQIKAAIDAYPKPKSGKADLDRASLKEALGTRRDMLTASDFLEYKQSRGETREGLKELERTCGRTGAGSNAFNYNPLLADGHIIVICPGDLFRAAMKPESRQRTVPEQNGYPTHQVTVIALDPLWFTYFHEVSHDIDFNQVTGTYQEMRACLWKNFGNDPSFTVALSHRPKEAVNVPAADVPMSELVADYWAAEGLARKLADKTPGQALAVLSRSVASLCDDGGGWKYVSGRFRIAVTLSRNPNLRRVMGCQPAISPKPYCEPTGPASQISTP